MKHNITTTTPQTMTCAELDTYTKAHLGLRTTLTEPETVNTNPPFPLTQDTHLPTQITTPDGIYTDTKQKLEAKGINVTGTEYVRVLDEEVLEGMLSVVTHASEGKITKQEAVANAINVGDMFVSENELEFHNMGLFKITSGNFVNSKIKTISLPYMTGAPSGNYFMNTSAVAIYLPNYVSGDLAPIHTCTKLNVVDYGDRCTNLFTLLWSAANPKGTNVVIRNTTPPSNGGYGNGVMPKYLFVPSSAIDAYKGKWSWVTNIVAIGGEEWIAEFGSADEYADYTKYGSLTPRELGLRD